MREALRSGRRIRVLYAARGASGLKELLEEAGASGIRVQLLSRLELEKKAASFAPQGIIAEVDPPRYLDLDGLIERLGPDDYILMLDGLQDPQNLGSILRSAEAAGCAGVIIPQRRSVELTPAAWKASAGAAEYVPVCRTVNLARALERIKREGFWTYALDAGGRESLWEADLKGRVCLIIGGEGKGVSRLVAEKCDFRVSIPMRGRISSLNAAVAAALAMFEAARRRGDS